jgi:hypothetical protein
VRRFAVLAVPYPTFLIKPSHSHLTVRLATGDYISLTKNEWFRFLAELEWAPKVTK